MVPELLRAPVAERARRLADGGAGWASELARDMLEAPSEARALVVDAALRDRAHELDARSAWPASALRLAGLGALLLATLGAVLGAGAPGLATAVVAGAGGVIGCGAIGARAKAELLAWRAAVDRLLDALAGDAGPRRHAAGGGRRRHGDAARAR